MEFNLTPKHILRLILRYLWLFILFPIMFAPIGYIAGSFIANSYKSDITILVQSQGLASASTDVTIDANVKKRIANIQDKVLSRTQLIKIIKKFNLYLDELETIPVEEVVKQMHSSIRIKIYASVFQISYESKNKPEQVMQVADELGSLFIRENIEYKQNVYETYQFLQKRLEASEKKIEQIEKKISDYKQQNLTSLPQYLNYNLNTRNSYVKLIEANTQLIIDNKKERNLLSSEFIATIRQHIEELKVLKDKKKFETQTINPLENNIELQEELAKKEREKIQLQQDIEKAEQVLAALLVEFTEAYPGVKRQRIILENLQTKLKEYVHVAQDAEIKEIEEYAYTEEQREVFAKQIEIMEKYEKNYIEYDNLQTSLVNLQAKVSKEPSPKNKKQLQKLEAVIAKIENRIFYDAKELKHFPKILQQTKRLYELQLEGQIFSKRQTEHIAALKKIEEDIQQTPNHERNLNDLDRERRIILDEHTKLTKNSQEAFMLKELEQEKRGGEFVILDPAYLPGIPYSLKKLLFCIAAVAMGIALAGVIAFLMDTLFPRVEDVSSLQKLTKKSIFAIPAFSLAVDKMKPVPMKFLDNDALPMKEPHLLGLNEDSKNDNHLLEQQENNKNSLIKFQQQLHEFDLPIHINKIHMNKQIPINNQMFRVLTILEEDYTTLDKLLSLELQPVQNLTAFFSPGSEIANMYRKLRFQVFPRDNELENVKKIVFTGITPGVGVTTTSLNVAGAIATGMVDKVIWIECNMANTVSSIFKQKPQKGLANLLAGEIKLSQAVRDTQFQRLKVLPAGESHLNPSELLSSHAMQKLVEDLEKIYPDHLLIFDAPAILSPIDISLLLTLTDRVVTVVCAHKTSKASFHQAMLKISKRKMFDLVINRTKVIGV